MLGYALHYITDSPKKIIAAYKKREDKALLEFDKGLGIGEALTLAFEGDENAEQIRACLYEWNDEFQSEMEKLLIYSHEGFLSVYSLSEADSIEEWGLGRRDPVALKNLLASVWTYHPDDNGLTFWSDEQNDENAEIHNSLLEKLRENRELLKDKFNVEEEHSNVTRQTLDYLSEILGFPIVLPDDWETRWIQERISSHIFLVSDRKAETDEEKTDL